MILYFEHIWHAIKAPHKSIKQDVTGLGLVAGLLSHLLKFEAFRLAGSFPAFSYFGTSCFSAWRFPTLALSYVDLFRPCFDPCAPYVCMLSWAAAHAAAC